MPQLPQGVRDALLVLNPTREGRVDLIVRKTEIDPFRPLPENCNSGNPLMCDMRRHC